MIKREPRRFIAQEVIDFKDLPVMENGVQQSVRPTCVRLC